MNTPTEKEIVDEIKKIYENNFKLQKYENSNLHNTYEDIAVEIFKQGINQGRKQIAEEIQDLSCHEAPNVCQCCQDLNQELQKEIK